MLNLVKYSSSAFMVVLVLSATVSITSCGEERKKEKKVYVEDAETKKQLKEVQAERDKLEKEIETLKKQINTLEATPADERAAKKIQILESQLKDANEKLLTTESKLERYMAASPENLPIQKAIDYAIEATTSEIEASKIAIDETQTAITSSKMAIGELTDKMIELELPLTEAAKKVTSDEVYGQELKEKASTYQTSEVALTAAQDKHRMLQQEHEQATNELTRLNKTLATYQGDRKALSEALAELKKSIAEDEEENAEDLEKYRNIETKIKILDDESERLKDEIATATETKDSLKESLNSSKAEVETAKKSFEQAQARASDLIEKRHTATRAALDAEKDKLAELETALKMHQVELENTQTDLERYQSLKKSFDEIFGIEPKE